MAAPRGATSTSDGSGGQVAEYEAFIENRLKVDLRTVLGQREKLLKQIADFNTLKHNLRAIEENQLASFQTLVNLGSEFYIKAQVPNTEKVFVNVGLGFHVEFTLAEALSFIDVKEAYLTGRVNELAQKANTIRSHIRAMYTGIVELKKVSGHEERR